MSRQLAVTVASNATLDRALSPGKDRHCSVPHVCNCGSFPHKSGLRFRRVVYPLLSFAWKLCCFLISAHAGSACGALYECPSTIPYNCLFLNRTAASSRKLRPYITWRWPPSGAYSVATGTGSTTSRQHRIHVAELSASHDDLTVSSPGSYSVGCPSADAVCHPAAATASSPDRRSIRSADSHSHTERRSSADDAEADCRPKRSAGQDVYVILS